MKRYLLLIAIYAALSPENSFAQQGSSASRPDSAVTWTFTATRNAAHEYRIEARAAIAPGWRLYSTTMPDTLPYSRLTLDTPGRARIVAPIVERGTLKTSKEALFGNATTGFFSDSVVLEATIRWNDTLQATTPSHKRNDIRGEITYMALLKAIDSVIGPLSVPFRFSVAPDGSLVAKSTALDEPSASGQNLKRASIDLAHPISSCGGTGAENSNAKTPLELIFLGFLGGLIALIMPCTFPMIPLTVSFFTKRSVTRSKGIFNAFTYGFFIFLIYVLVSVPFYFLKANQANILNDISTNVWLNVIFSAIFIAFALSFFGLFEITLPGGLSNTVGAKSDIGSLGGIFFMALTLAIVSFSCTGPILGTLLVGTFNQGGGAVQLTYALAGFGMALGLPFGLFALFPHWLQRLPRSGAWMNTVKIVFGFVELALAFKYFSNADLVDHWGLLRREIFVMIWILIDLILVLYLFGVVKFRHHPPPAILSKGRIGTAFVFALFGLYLVPALTNTPYARLSLLSGILPPLSYSIYPDNSPHLVNDYEGALALARRQHKPVMIDFTGWACANCRRMEENVWPDPKVDALIKEHFVLVSLYVDDRKPLPDDQQFLFTTADGSKKPIKTIGDKYATLQAENFHSAAQPLYAIISPDERLMVNPVAYTPDPSEYAAWLQCGLDAYSKSR